MQPFMIYPGGSSPSHMLEPPWGLLKKHWHLFGSPTPTCYTLIDLGWDCITYISQGSPQTWWAEWRPWPLCNFPLPPLGPSTLTVSPLPATLVFSPPLPTWPPLTHSWGHTSSQITDVSVDWMWPGFQSLTHLHSDPDPSTQWSPDLRQTSTCFQPVSLSVCCCEHCGWSV